MSDDDFKFEMCVESCMDECEGFPIFCQEDCELMCDDKGEKQAS